MKLNCVFTLGDGRRVRFWEDTWCGENPLCDTFPSLFMLTETKGIKVAEVWDNTRRGGD